VPDSASGSPDFDYGPGQPNLYRMMRYKQDLVARFGVREGFAQFRAKFGWPIRQTLGQVRVESERDFAAAHAEFFRETAVGGIPFVNQPPVVHGEGNHRPLRGVTRSQYVACLRDARVRGRSGAVMTGDRLLLDFQRDELSRVDEEFEWDPTVFHAEPGAAWYLPAADEDAPLQLAEAFNLLGAHTDFFGHWMCEYLPKYAAAALTGALPRMPVLIDANMPAAHRQTLELLFPEQQQIVEIEALRSVLVQRLWVAPDVSYYPLYDAGTGRFEWDAISVAPERIAPIMEELRRRADARLARSPDPAARVFLARRSFRHRRLVNDAEIYAEAQRHGFQVMYPEDLSFAEQVGLMQGASEIVAPEGSATFLIQFAAPGARACILSHPMTEPLSDFHEMFRAVGIGMTALTGPIVKFNAGDPHDADYSIDVAKFSEFLREWLDGRRGRRDNAHPDHTERARAR
jgi:capsular polysaccharide biosynthesis protein